MPREVWVLVVGSFLVAIGYGLVAPVLPSYAASFGVGATAVSVVISIFAFTRLIFAPLGGYLLQKLSERPIYLTGLAIVGSSNVGLAYAGSFEGLLVARGVGGIGSTLFSIAGFALLVRVTPTHMRGRASAAYSAGFLIGNITGPILGGLLVGISYRTPFLVYAAMIFLVMILFQLLLRGRHRSPRPAAGPKGGMSVREALRQPIFRAALASNFATGWWVYGVRIAILPLFMVEILAASEAQAGVAITVFALGNAVLLPFAGRWADRYGRRGGVFIGLLIAAVGVGWIAASHSLWELFAACVISGMGVGLMTPGQQAAAGDVVGARGGGSVLTLFQMSADIGGVIGPVAVGMLVDGIGYGVGFWITTFVLVAGALPWLLVGKQPGGTAPRRA